MRITCTNCGGAHPRWECKRPASKSTAARKDVRSGEEVRTATAPSPAIKQRAKQRAEAGTQAPPVDPIPAPSPSGKASGFDPDTAGSNPAGASKKGRPRIHPDRKAYKAQKQREYRARKAAEKEAGK